MGCIRFKLKDIQAFPVKEFGSFRTLWMASARLRLIKSLMIPLYTYCDFVFVFGLDWLVFLIPMFDMSLVWGALIYF